MSTTHAINRNPRLPCVICGEKQKCKNWEAQYGRIDRSTTLRCKECLNNLIRDARIERRRKRNEQISDY